MKSAITAALLTIAAAAFAAEADPKSNVTITPHVSGKATITIQVNGKTETREVDLGDATKVEIRAGDEPAGKGAKSTWLGVTPDALSEEVAAQLPIPAGTGLLLRAVADDGPAAQAGLRKNDVLAKLDDQLLANADQLRTLVSAHKEGEKVRLTYYRQGKEASVDVTLGAREGGDARNRFALFFDALKGGVASLGSDSKPLQSAVDAAKAIILMNKDGHTVSPREDTIAEATRQLEKSLETDGMDEATVRKLKESFAKTAEEIRDAVARATASHGEMTKQIQETVNQAVERARRTAEEQSAKALERARHAADEAKKQAEARRQEAAGQPKQ